jgi:hypothetical protein
MHILESGMRCFEPFYDSKVSELLAFSGQRLGSRDCLEEESGIAFRVRSRFTTSCLRASIWLKQRRYSVKNLRLGSSAGYAEQCRCVFDVRFASDTDQKKDIARGR